MNRQYLHIIRREDFYGLNIVVDDILKGSLIGSVLDNGELDFVYHHMNSDNIIGICR